MSLNEFFVHIPYSKMRAAFMAHAAEFGFTVPAAGTIEAEYPYLVITMDARIIHTYLLGHISIPSVSIDTAMKKITQVEQVICKIDDYNVIKLQDGIKVGCVKVSKDKIELIADAVLTPREYRFLDAHEKIEEGDEVIVPGPSPRVWTPVDKTKGCTPHDFPNSVFRRRTN